MINPITEVRKNTLELLGALPGIKTFDDHFTKADHAAKMQIGANPKVISLQEQDELPSFYLAGQTVYLEQTIKFKIWLLPIAGRYSHYETLIIPDVLHYPLEINNLKEIVQENTSVFAILVAYIWRMNSEIMQLVSFESKKERDLLNLKLTETEIKQVLKPGHMFNSEIDDPNFIKDMEDKIHPEAEFIKKLIVFWQEVNQHNQLEPVIKVNVDQITKNLFTEYISDRLDLELGNFADLKVNFKPIYLKTDSNEIVAELYDAKANEITRYFYYTNTFKLVKELYRRPEMNFSYAECKLDYETDVLTIKVLKTKVTWKDKVRHFFLLD